MPEGDSLRRARLLVLPILVGHDLTDVWFRKIRGHRPRKGQSILAVEAVGKHLLIEFDRGLTLQTHLGMAGSWKVLGADTDLRRVHQNPKLRVRLTTPAGHALCFAAPAIQTFLRDVDPSPIAHLGPDLADRTPDLDAVVARCRRLFSLEGTMAELLLDQRVAAGIGNVFKSEVLHLERMHPFTLAADVDDEKLRAVYATAAKQLWRNSQQVDRRRTTTSHGGYFVYERWRKPCRRCQTPVERSYAGVQGRSTYWCPRCQPMSNRPTGTDQ